VIRFHIKALVLGWLGSLDDPTPDEWRIVSSHLLDPDDPVFDHAWNLLVREPWFELADAEFTFERLLSYDDARIVDRAVWALRAMQRDQPSRVAELLEPFVGQSEEWNRRLIAVVQWADLGTDRKFFELVLRLLDIGALDEARGAIAVNSDFWDIGFGLQDRPPWAVEYIARYLERHLLVAQERGIPNPFDRSEGTIADTAHNEQFFMDAAAGAPMEFVSRILPIFLQVSASAATQEHENERLRRDPIWSYRYRADRFGVSGALLDGMEHSLQRYASAHPTQFAELAAQLGETELETPNFLAVRGFLGAAAPLAEEAAQYLLKEPLRLRAGYIDDDHWAARELLGTIFPHLCEKTRLRIEDMLVSYETPWEASAAGYKGRGHSRFTLLSGLPEDLLSPKGMQELDQLRRKFERSEPAPPRGIVGGFVGSPIPQAAAEKMTDEQWLGAMDTYRGEREWSEFGDSLRGDAEELAHELERLTKEQPGRFAALAERIPDSAHTSYFDAILRGVAASEGIRPDIVLQVCGRCHALPGQPCGRWITMPIERIASHDIPVELIQIVAWYASNHPDPETEIWEVVPEGFDRPYYDGDVHSAGINSARGAAASTIAALIDEHPTRIDALSETFERLSRDGSIAVRSCAAQALLALYRHDSDRAVELFERLIDAPDQLLATPWVERFIGYATRAYFERLEPVLWRMLGSNLDRVGQTGGRQAVMALIATNGAWPIARAATSHPSASVRRGAAQVAAANIDYAEAQGDLTAILSSLFDDEDKKVREETVSAFRRLSDRPEEEWAELLSAFVSSRAFPEGARDLFFALGEAGALPLRETAAACARLADHLENQSDAFHARGIDTDRASQLLLHVYQGAEGDEELRREVLDTIDRLARLQVYGLDTALAAYER
jgi:hypothetical protein